MEKSKIRLRRILHIALSVLYLVTVLPQPATYAASLTNENILAASDKVTFDYFGSSAAVSGDYAIVGAPGAAVGEDIDAGQAYIYHYNGTGWEQQQILTASDKSWTACFGSSVAISGDYAIVGANGAVSGADSTGGQAYIFHYNGTSWVEQQILTASDQAHDDNFGYSVSISGNYAIVGAAFADPEGLAEAGKAYMYHYNGTSWDEEQILTASDKVNSDYYGRSVSISGDNAIVSAPGAQKCYLLYNSGAGWVEQQILTASDSSSSSSFGNSVSISGDYAIVAAQGVHKGYLFYNNGTAWVEQQILTASDSSGASSFGFSASISGDYVIISARIATADGILGAGKAYLYRRNGTSWDAEQILSSSDKSQGDIFGYSVSISGDKAIVGATEADSDGIYNAGKAYAYTFPTYDVNYDENNGSGTMSASSGIEGDAISLSANTFTRAGYLFAGWSSTSGGAAEYADGADYAIPASNSTLYAVWTSSAPELGFIPGSEFWITTFSDKNYKDAGDTSDETTYTAIRFGEYVNIKADEIKAQLIVTGGSIKIFDGSNTDITDSTSAYIGSTCTVALYDTLNNLTKTYLVTLKGDVNGDGYILTQDVVLLRKYTVNSSALTIAQKYAGDINKDGYVLTPDVVALRKFTVNTEIIDQTN